MQSIRISLSTILLGCALIATSPLANAQMVTGENMQDFASAFDVVIKEREVPYRVVFTESTAPGNIVWPDERPSFSFQLQNQLDTPMKFEGTVELINYGTRGIPGDIWKPEVFKIATVDTIPISVDMSSKGFQNFTVTPKIPGRLGGYALVFDLGKQGRQFGTSFVRTFKANPQRLQYPALSLDDIGDDTLHRLGVQAVRYGISYVSTTDPDYPKWRAELDARLASFRKNNITVLLMVGASYKDQPLGRGRPHLDANDVMIGGKQDLAWMHDKDKDFQKLVTDIAGKSGWPKGPVTAMSLWNEPWEGLSISGWGADMLRYREIFTAMAHGVEDARAKDKVQVLLAGADSSSNTFDKFFADGKDDYLKWLDAITIHYQGLSSPSTYKKWINRKSPNGRVKIWDTESWTANTDDRFAAVVATNRAAGYDRAMGIYGGNISSGQDGGDSYEIFQSDGTRKTIKSIRTWAPAAAVGAAQRFLGERPFREILFKKGLPWIMVFDGPKEAPEDGTVVVVGDIGEEFGADNVPFRTVRGLNEVKAKSALKLQLAALSSEPDKQADIRSQIDKPMVLSGGSLTLSSQKGLFGLYDFYGNSIVATGGKIQLPLDHRGFFLRGNGRKGSFNALVNALKAARIEGYEPLETKVHDFVAPISSRPTLRLTLTNIYNRPVNGALSVTVAGLQLQYPKSLSFAAFETKEINVKVVDGQVTVDNGYPLQLRFDAGKDGVAVHEEVAHVNVIAHKTIKVDGKLDDWKGALPDVVRASNVSVTQAQAAWFPFQNFDANTKEGVAVSYTAYDDKYFYFASKIADSTLHTGTVRFAKRDDDAYFYPETSYEFNKDKSSIKRDGKLPADAGNKSLLQNPTGDGRVGDYWEDDPQAQAFSLDLNLPEGKMQQVAIYLGGGELHPNGISLKMLDAKSGAELDKAFVGGNLWNGTWAVFNAAGHVRLRLQANGDWYTAKVFGVFFDPTTGTTAPTGSAAKFLKWDYDTSGNWKGVYGKNGFHIVGQSAQLPAGVSLDVPKEIVKTTYEWPKGVRRYSYRKWPTIPGSFVDSFDAVQIAFNAVPVEKEDMLPNPPNTPAFFTDYKSTDYEYQFSKVAPQYGGGTEVFRLLVPGMPRKHFYPRQPKSPFDGDVVGAHLSIIHEGNTRIVEAAIPWSEIPDVAALMKAKKPLKFAYRVVNDDGTNGMESSLNRSVNKPSGLAFHYDWGGHWSNEVEFGWGQ